MSRTAHQSDRSIRRYLLAGVASLGLLVAGVGGLAAMTKLSGAVIAPGRLVVDTNVKKVQHPSGGVIGAIRVREGDPVKAGQLLVRLDATVTEANLAIVSKSLDEFEARQARLEAERDGAETISFPEGLPSDLMAGETSLFRLRYEVRAGKRAQLKERIAQLGDEISGLGQQKTAKAREMTLIADELDGIRKLWKQKLVSIGRVTLLERDAARLEGEHGRLIAAIAQAKGRVSETELQILQIDQDFRSEVAGELRDVEAKIAEYSERKIAAGDQLKRIDIRAPQDGVVHQLTVHTVGGVVQGGETLMLIVPVSDELTVEARIAPQDIDQIAAGQDALLRLSAFNQATTPELAGRLVTVAADLTTDEKTGSGFYSARVRLPRSEIARLNGLALTPGMPAEVFFPTQERTILSYLVKPLSDQMERAFREE
ncbi:MAG: HlyD family type I secretion periplasmic adaptor subunit [Pseudomonadota bacterium]